MIHVTPERIAFIVDGKLEKRLKGILEDLGWPFEVTAGLAKVSAVGAGMHGVPGVMARVASALLPGRRGDPSDDRLPCEHLVPGARGEGEGRRPRAAPGVWPGAAVNLYRDEEERIVTPFGEVLTAMVTPMRPDGAVDYEKARQLAAVSRRPWLRRAGRGRHHRRIADADRRREVSAASRPWLEAVAGRAKVIAGTGSYDTQGEHRADPAGRTDRGRRRDAGRPLLQPAAPGRALPALQAPIAEATHLPVMLYNVPSRTSRNLEPETVARLARALPNVVA